MRLQAGGMSRPWVGTPSGCPLGLTWATLNVCSVIPPWSAMAASDLCSFSPIALSAMSNRLDAQAKETEGRLESAYGELTGDTGHQIQGKAKQVQGSAMNVAEDLKAGGPSQRRRLSLMRRIDLPTT